MGIGPGGAFAELDLERHDEIGCSAHLRHDNRADRRDFIRRSFEDERFQRPSVENALLLRTGWRQMTRGGPSLGAIGVR